MQTEYQYMKFVLMGDSGKTTRWAILNRRTGVGLGEVKWYGAWRSYCFFPISNTVFNTSCMGDIIDFIEQLNKARKE